MTTDPKLIEREEKPREWILRKGDFKPTELDGRMMLYNGNDYYHVIEKSSLTALEHKLEVAMDALERTQMLWGQVPGKGTTQAAEALPLISTALATIKGAKP